MFLKKILICFIALTITNCSDAKFLKHGGGSAGGIAFDQVLPVGGGGWVVGLSASSDGTFVARTDTYGGYIGTPGAFTSWATLLTQSSIPVADWVYSGTDDEIYDLVISPNDANYIYMIFNNLFFYSSNKGVTWTRTNTAQFAKMSNYCAGPFRQNDYHMVVDPANKLHVLVGTPLDGLRETFDGGVTFTSVSAIPPATSDGGTCGNSGFIEAPGYIVAFDGHSATTGAGATLRSSIAYVYTYEKVNLTSASWSANTMTFIASAATRIAVGDTFVVSGMSIGGYNGTWTAIAGSSGTTIKATNATTLGAATGGAIDDPAMYSTSNGGTTWSSTINIGGPYGVQNMVVGNLDGTVWLTDTFAGQSGVGFIWKFQSGAWTKFTTQTANWHSITIDPTNALRVIAGTGQCGQINITPDGGTSWSNGGNSYTRGADAAIGWLSYGNESCLSNGAQVFDPSQSNLLVFAHGVGVSSTTPPASGTAANVFTFITKGIEQMISRAVIMPHGFPILGFEDTGTFQVPSPGISYPTHNNNTYLNTFTLDVTSALDWAKFTNTNFTCAVTFANVGNGGQNSGCSSDGGANFQPFNRWLADVPNTSLAVDGSNRIIITVPTTAGLTTWFGGTGSIVRVLQGSAGRLSSTGVGPLYWPVTVNDATHITLQGSVSGSNFSITSGANYRIYDDTGPRSNFRGNLTVTGTFSDGGKIGVNVVAANGVASNGDKVCLTGVGGTTEADGCWNPINNTATSITLDQSTFVHAWTSGGILTANIPTGGTIAVSTPSNIILTPGNNDFPYCTQDGGLTWTQLRSTPTSGDTGWAFANYERLINWVADPNTINHFWGISYVDGIFEVTNCTITLKNGSFLGTPFGTLRAVPGHQNHLIWSAGPAASKFSRSTDGGATWTDYLTSITETGYIDVGPVAPGATYNTLYFWGQLNPGSGVKKGLFRTKNPDSTTPTWELVSEFPGGSLDEQNAIAADQTNWSRWVVCHQGSSCAWGLKN